MKHEIKSNGFVKSLNIDQFKRTKYPVKAGDRIEWKRNGSRGSVNAVVIGFADTKPNYVLVQNCTRDWEHYGRPTWIRDYSVLLVK